MKRVVIVVAAVCMIAILAAGALATSRSSTQRPTSAVALGTCPKDVAPLPGDAVARAADQARAQAATLYPDSGRAVVMASDRAALAGVRGDEVNVQCGQVIFRRTVVVQLFFPEMLPSASLSQGTVFVSLFATGYQVWEVAH